MPRKKRVKKEWFLILAPEYLGNKEIGKTLTNNPKNLVGRRLVISAIDLTNDLSKYYLKLGFRIISFDGNKKIAKTEFDSSECLRDYIARMIVRRVTRIDVIQDEITKDNKKIRVKSIAVLPRRPTSSVRRAVRKKISEEIKEIVSNCILAKFVHGILNEEWKKRIADKIRKIYPLRNFEIRKVEMLGNNTHKQI